MKKPRSIRTTLVIMAAVAIIIYAVFFMEHSAPEPTEQNAAGELIVTFIDIGQGDSELIQQGDNAVLIDTGEYSQRQILTDTLGSLGVTSLDYVIATHPHSDHIGSMNVIIDSYDVRHVMMPYATANTVSFQKMLESISKKGLHIEHPAPGSSIRAGNIELEILAPNSDKYEDTNDISIITRLQWGATAFIFEGDAEALSEKEVLNKGFNVSADVIKIGHHGSSSSSSDAYLDAVNPRAAVITCGQGNVYGHPHKEVLDRLSIRNIAVYRTDTMGTITMRSNGTDITVETQK